MLVVTKYYYEDRHSAFSLVEESGCFRIKTGKAEIEEQHVEEFLDKTVEWLSSNPDKSMLIDFDGVKWVCSDFLAQLIRYYEDSRARGLTVPTRERRSLNSGLSGRDRHPGCQPST